MENPFKYVPGTAKQLTALDRNSKEYKKLMKKVCSSPAFSAKLTESIVRGAEIGEDDNTLNAIAHDTRMLVWFLRIAVVCAGAGAAIEAFFRNSPLIDYSIYLFGAGALTIPFAVYHGHGTSKGLRHYAEKCLESYRIPDERFSDERIDELIALRTSNTDVIATSELDMKIPCGCYGCISHFTSDRLQHVPEEAEYTCPVCGRTTIISERCGREITDELLRDMHDYWTE